MRWVLGLLLFAAIPAQAATITLPTLTVQGTVSSCPDDDGSAGSSGGVANYPALITAGNYKAAINGAHGLGCKVAGVDYYVGVPQGLALKDPTTAALPAGCKYDGKKYVDCTGTVAISGYDFSLHQTLLTGSGATTVTNDKFVFGPNCTDPVINVTGSLIASGFTIDGTPGWTCNLNQGFGSFVNVNPPAGGVVSLQYFSLIKVPQDAFDINQPSTGNVATTIRYGIIYLQGSTGHPDGIQFCGGGTGVMTPNDVEHVTWYGTYTPGPDAGGIQPFHIEAQTCGGVGHIANTVVAYNTGLAVGTCQGGNNWPVGCAANFVVACKQDDTSTNKNFSAYGNYIDWSGAITALTNGYGCPSTTWGSPQANYDMSAGTVLGNKPAAVFAARVIASLTAKLKAEDLAHRARMRVRSAMLRTLETQRQARLRL